MSHHEDLKSIFAGRAKVYHKDLVKAGLVTSRFDQHKKIKARKLRAPNKNGDTPQSVAWWWAHELLHDLERERELTSHQRETTDEK